MQRYLVLMIIPKGRIARYTGIVYLIEHRLLYNPDITQFSAVEIQLKY
jgi:hypothetical protein